MQAVNKKMDPTKTMQTLQNFQKETAKMDMTEEMSKININVFVFFVIVCGCFKIGFKMCWGS